MTRFFVTVIGTALLAGGAYGQRIVKRQQAQETRIHQGVRSGELTRKEAARLQAQENRLAAEIRRDRIDGGRLTPAERAKIEKKQDRLSREIYRQKHDAQRRL